MTFDFNLYQLDLLTTKNSESFFNLIQKNKLRLNDFFAGTVAKTTSLEATVKYCNEVERKITHREYFPYLIKEKATGKLIGLIDIKNIDWNIPKAELGAFIDSDFEGHGIITNYLKNLIDDVIKKHHFRKLLCRIAEDNKRSIQVALNCGFELEGTIRCDYRTTDGKLIDLNYYGKVFST